MVLAGALWLGKLERGIITFGNATPVEQTFYHCLDMIGTAVLPVEIVGVFPYVGNYGIIFTRKKKLG